MLQHSSSPSQLPESAQSPAQSSPSRLPTLSRRPTTSAADRDNGSRKQNLLPQPASSKMTGSSAAQRERGNRNAGQLGQPAPANRPLNRTQSVSAKLTAASKNEEAARRAMPPPPAPGASGLRAPTKIGSSSGAPKSGTVSQPGPGRSNRPGSATSTASQTNTGAQRPSQRERSRAATVSAPQAERTRPAATSSQKLPPPSSSGLKAGGTVLKHSRSRSELASAATRTQPSLASSRAAPGLEKEPKLAAKPAFSTLQQHYSPKKTLEPKKATSTFFHAPSVSTGGADALWGEALALQTELLQLHLLHEAAAEVQAEWERSAEHALRLQFYEVATAHHNMRKNESEVQELVNVHALQEWKSGSATSGLAENIQLLGPLLNELRALTDSGGRHTRAVQEFEEWAARAEQVWAGREAGQRVEVVSRLGDAWKVEVGALLRKETALAREAEGLAEAAAGSSIRAVVDGSRALVAGMVEELQLMRRVEVLVGEDEARFVESGLQGIAAETEHAHALWRRV
ncbi:hypothetical protein B0J12DRAFT_571847 [Macrophomina phaseolina]|uniref:QWRF family protein n=1 Tax=Macrophomina phaseolina TaxID=35725 RepID=A0ABQ8GD54_9PEZI|nr:hypothetical protein B0J12DRAFT_571847 [Macrophomina phaseolina]